MFDRKFVPNSPQRPTYRTQTNPENPLSRPSQRIGKVSQLKKGGGVPSNLEPGSDTTPDQLSKHTMKKDMIHVLQGTPKSTKLRARHVSLTNLVSRGETASEGLPEEDFNFRRNSRPPNAGEPIRRDTSNDPRVQGFN